MLIRQGQWRQAEAELLRALEFADTDGLAQKKLALIALQYHYDPGRAIAYGDQALIQSPDAATWTTQGVALRMLGRFAEAEKAYRRALATEPESVDIWLNLGNLYRDLGQLHMALGAYENVAQKGGSSPLVERALQEIKAINTTIQ